MFFFKRNKKQLPEGLDISALPALIKKTNPVILEIGCNDGTQTKIFHETFPEAEIYAFEPDPRAQNRFIENVGHNPKIHLITKAISDRNGTTTFFMSDGVPDNTWEGKLPNGWDLSGSIRKPKEHLEKHPWCTFEKTIEVETQTLDSFCEEVGISEIDFIWADVQGAEADLIRGAAKSLQCTRYFYTEYCDDELYEGQLTLKKIKAMLPRFDQFEIYKNDVLFRRR